MRRSGHERPGGASQCGGWAHHPSEGGPLTARHEPKDPLSERLFYGSSDVLRKLAPSPSRGKKRGFFRSMLGLFQGLLFLVGLLFLPLFWLPFLVVRIFHFGRSSIGQVTTVDVTSGDAARWEQPVIDALPGGPDIGVITSHDPGFDPEVLPRWAVDAVSLIGRSLTSGDPTPVQPVMAGGLLRTHCALLDLRARANVSCEGSWSARAAEVTNVVRTPLVEMVRVRLACQGWCWERHLPTGLTIRGGPDPATWSEELTFGRSAEAQTPPGGGLPAHRCPSCGAPLALDPSGACQHCRGVVTAGRYDWVLVGWERDPW